MSLAVAFKGPEGIVLAADSRVTLNARQVRGSEVTVLPATYDNATKLLRVNSHSYVGAVTYGVGALGQVEPRTAHSYLPEFEDELPRNELGRVSVEEFARRLADFFLRQWNAAMASVYRGPDMVFLVGGFDDGAPYGRVFEVKVAGSPEPREMTPGQFGLSWGGQREFVDRLLQGYDPRVLTITKDVLDLDEIRTRTLEDRLRGNLTAAIPYQFLPLQDCVDLSIFLIRTTVSIQKWLVGIRRVGGAIDVATITRTEGSRPIQQKQISGERGGR